MVYSFLKKNQKNRSECYGHGYGCNDENDGGKETV